MGGRIFFLEVLGALGAINLAFREHDLTTQNAIAFGAGEAILMPFLLESRDAQAIDDLVALCTDGAASLVIVLLAVGETLVLEELAVMEGLAALVAGEVVLVPVLVEGRDGSAVGDGLVALGAGEAEQLVVMLLAVGVVVLLVELAVVEGLSAGGAVEAGLVEVLVEGLQVLALDFLFAAGASGQEGGLVAVLAVGVVVFHEKFLESDFLVALSAAEAGHVVQGVESLKSFSLDVLAAATALGGSDSGLLHLLELVGTSVVESLGLGSREAIILDGLISVGEALVA